MNKFALLALLFTVSLFGENNEAVKGKMCADLDAIKGIFQTQYAPTEWKQTYGGWILEEKIENAKDQVRNTDSISIKDYQRILHEFFQSTQDFHVSISFYSTESANLPFLLKSAQNRYFITGLTRDAFPRSPIEIGDEIKSFNGRPIAEVLNEFRKEELKRGDSLSDLSVAEMFFTKRSGSQGHLIPDGNVSLGVRHKGERKDSFYSINWNYSAERIKNISLGSNLGTTQMYALSNIMEPIKALGPKQKTPLGMSKVFKKSMLSPYYKPLSTTQVFDAAGEGLGSRNSFVPALGKKIWTSHPDSDFHAYLFETPDRHRYGYIRIPHFDASTYEFEQFKELVQRLEEESEALIIDQINNPGGSVFYMYALLSTLTDKPLTVPNHRIALTQKEIAFGLSALSDFESASSEEDAIDLLGDSLDGLPITMDTVNKISDYFHFLQSQWNLGITFTSPFPLYGFYEIHPDYEVRYTKPIMVLINQMDFSCADFFPSILQDNKRATLLGTTTGGAGGFVLTAKYPNLFGVEEMSYTGSIAYRDDNNPIENLGVKPDIEYRLTVEDLTSCYEPFKAKILESVKKLKR